MPHRSRLLPALVAGLALSACVSDLPGRVKTGVRNTPTGSAAPSPRGSAAGDETAPAASSRPSTSPASTAPSAGATPAQLASASPGTPPVVDFTPAITGTLKASIALLAENGLQIVSHNGGNLISDKGGGVLANGALLIGKTKYHTLAWPAFSIRQVPPGDALALGYVQVGLYDALGEPVVDERGQALRATTDEQGRFAFARPQAPGNYLVKAVLPDNRATFSSIVTPAFGPDAPVVDVEVDDASTVAASYLSGLLGKLPAPKARLDNLGESVTDQVHEKLKGAIANRLGDVLPIFTASEPPSTVFASLRSDAAVAAPFDQLETNLWVSGVFAGPAIETYGVWGYTDGKDARFNVPRGCAFDKVGNLYVADSRNNVIRKIAPDGTVSTFAGSQYPLSEEDGAPPENSLVDGPGAVAKFCIPADLAFGPDGNLYVADFLNHAIRKIDLKSPERTVSTVLGGKGPGYAEGGPDTAKFQRPRGIAFGPDGSLYVADHLNHAIRKVTLGAVPEATTLAGGQEGYAEGQGPSSRWRRPTSLVVGPDGTVYVSDTANYVVRAIAQDGTTKLLAGTPEVAGRQDGVGARAKFGGPWGLDWDPRGGLFLAEDGFNQPDRGNGHVRHIALDGTVTTFAGKGSAAWAKAPPVVRLAYPGDVALDAFGRVYVVEGSGHRIFRVSGQ